MRKRKIGIPLRGAVTVLFCAGILWTVSLLASATSFADALDTVRSEVLPMALIRRELGEPDDGAMSVQTAWLLRFSPILYGQRTAVTEVWSSELQTLPREDSEEHEGTTLSESVRRTEPGGALNFADNGVPSRTLRPSDPAGYTVAGRVYINNASACALDAAMLTGDFAAKCGADGPQVLIVHTHGTEAYTMPAGEAYAPSDDHRTLEENKNMLRVGDEIAQVLTDMGLETLHDRGLYDYPNYSGAYNRSLAAVEEWREKYPSIVYVLDVHRDAVSDGAGNEYKLLCAENANAAQLEMVLGTSGGGAEHPQWRENLKLACAVQETLLGEYPTLMRPIVLRNSRYNQQVTPGALLVEVGTAGNSLDEAIEAGRLFAKGFAETVLATRE